MDAKNIFAKYLDGGRILLDNKGQSVDLVIFEQKFASASENPTYTELMVIDGYVDENNQGMGYKNFFDKCKVEGILL